ncbi:MAG TPA: CHAT domain-containing protein [Myxococcaceae bacterium]|nr:CHAT domain-containing protein [Myxococcaceae bacterium]
MSAPCDQVQDFFDGALNDADADRYREHAAGCARCQRELTVLSQLRALETLHRPELEARARAQSYAVGLAPRARVTRWRWALGGAAAALAAMLLLWLGSTWPGRGGVVPDQAFSPAATARLTDGRSADPRARRYLPMAQRTLGKPGEAPTALGYEALAALERRGDRLGVAAAHLARGTAADAEAALEALGAARTADELSELAFAHLVRGKIDASHLDAEEALALADRALALDARHGPALWNRALALQALKLPMAAAKAFDAAAALGEPGWAEEARSRARELRAPMDEARRTWMAAYQAGAALVAGGAWDRPDLLRVPVVQSLFHDAVRARTSRADLERLRPLARDLDAAVPGAALEAYLSRVAARDFAVRGPLAAELARLAKGEAVDAAALAHRAEKAGEVDLLLAVLEQAPRVERRAAGLEAIARGAGEDVWLATEAARLQAQALESAGRVSEAQAVLEAALQRCLQAGLDYPCGEVELDLTYSIDHAFDLERAAARAREGWELIQRTGDWGQQLQFMLELAQLARRQERFAVSRGSYEEALGRGATPEQQRYAYEGLAHLDVALLRFDEARRDIDAALATGRTLGLPGALVLGDIARARPAPERDTAAMEAFRKGLPQLGGGRRALAEEALGRWELERDRARGTGALRDAIARATAGDLAAGDPAARQALAYAYTALILDAGKRGDAAEALHLFEEEWRLGGARGLLPERCLLAVTADDERLLAVVRGAGGGAAVAVYDGARAEPLPRDLSGALPAAAIRPLEGCAQVDVLARAPVYGRPGLLPGRLAWRYRSPGVEAAAASGPPRHLVVQEPALSRARAPLAAPPRWQVTPLEGESTQELTRAEATPEAVERRVSWATDLTLIAHGVVLPDSEEASLVLAPDARGRDALRASEVEKLRLEGHPLVVLVACQAARPAPVLHEARSLPAAFLRAGARAVLAASDFVPERDGPEFFAAVRARIHGGAAPAEALRAERSAWQAGGRGGPWLDGVLLFE